MSRRIVVLLVLVSTALRSLQAARTDGKRAIIRRFGQCRAQASLPILFHTVLIRPNPSKKTEKMLSFKVTIREELSAKFTIVINFWRCDSSGNPDSCELILKDFHVKNVCEIMGKKNELWSDFMDHFDMPSRCPIKTGTYSMTNCPINTDFMRFIPMSNALYKIKLTGWVGSKQVACIDLEEQVLLSSDRRH